MKFKFILHITVALILWSQSAMAITIAVFPFDDLSKDYNSLGNAMTSYMAEEIRSKGIDLVEEKQVYDYMAGRTIRHLGYMETRNVLSAKDELGADFILLGSVCQSQKKQGSVGVTVNLIRTTDAKIVWAESVGTSVLGEQRLLGLNSPDNYNEILSLMAGEIFTSWPKDLDFSAGRQLAEARYAALKESSLYSIDSVSFSPKYIKPGGKVRCTVRLRRLTAVDQNEQPKIYIRVANKVYLAESNDGMHYEASWVGSDSGPGQGVQVAMAAEESQLYREILAGPDLDSRYPVNLVVDWQSGKREETYLGSYTVDSRAPEIILKSNGTEMNGKQSFYDNLSIHPRMIRREPITMWELSIFDQAGEEVLHEKGRGKLPGHLVWYGPQSKKHREISQDFNLLFKVWDRAGNEGETDLLVRYLPETPELDISLKKQNNHLVADFSYGGEAPIVAWNLEFWSSKNILLKKIAGEQLPIRVELPLAGTGQDDEIECILASRNGLGNKHRQVISNLMALLATESIEDIPSQNPTLDTWRADF